MKNKSSGNHQFSQVPRAEIQRSSFDRSHGVKTTFDSGALIPIFCDEYLPGDTANLRTSGFARLSTPIYPTMDNMYMETFYFAVPIRLLWDNFQKMMGEQANPSDSIDYIVPTMLAPLGGFAENSVQDFLGIPTKVDNLEISALFTRAHNLIWNEWFRDQNLQDSLPVPTDDGPDDPLEFTIQKRGKRHDYFTSCLPWPQKGPEIMLPLGQAADIIGIGVSGAEPSIVDDRGVFKNDGSGDQTIFTSHFGSTNVATEIFVDANKSTVPTGAPHIYADLDNATAATINQLRQAFQVQKMYERDARGGTRYTEIIKSHFGVTSPDARLQRPEYLGGGSSRVNITPIAQTSNIQSVGGTGTVGTLAAMGTASFQGHGFTKSFTEHTIVLGFVNVRADLTYQQGLNKMFSRKDKLDFFWPALAHIGEQAVLNREIYATGTAADDDVFGYQERFAEYRYKPSTVHGLFRSNSDLSLDAWHLSQDFADTPTLSEQFITDQPPVDRIVAVPSEPQFIGDFHHKLITARPMPLYGVPGNIDRF